MLVAAMVVTEGAAEFMVKATEVRWEIWLFEPPVPCMVIVEPPTADVVLVATEKLAVEVVVPEIETGFGVKEQVVFGGQLPAVVNVILAVRLFTGAKLTV